MLLLDYIQLALNINGNPIVIQPSAYSFSQTDSIYELYNTCSMMISDVMGFIAEHFLITEGTEIELAFGSKYGNTSYINNCPYVIQKISQKKKGEHGIMAGELKCKLSNLFYQYQMVGNKGYYDEISDIVTSILSNYGLVGFTKLDIDTTGNLDYWYRTQQTDADFITDTLLPNAYSSGANNSPYFAFITSDNTFHFRNIYSMLKANPVITFEYRVPPVLLDKDNQSLLYRVNDFRRWQEGSLETKKFRHRNVYSVNRITGKLNKDQDNITDYPSSEKGNLSIINDENLITGYHDLGYDEQIQGRKENLLGQKINSTRDSALLDRFLINTQFHPEVLAGDVIKLNCYQRDLASGNYIISPIFSGNYLVEKSQHFYSGSSLKAYSIFYIGRKFIPTVPSSYNLKSKLMGTI